MRVLLLIMNRPGRLLLDCDLERGAGQGAWRRRWLSRPSDLNLLQARTIHSSRRTSSASDQFERIALQPYLSLHYEHQQQHADLLARDLGAETGMTDERAGNDVYAVADPRHDGAVTIARAQGVDHRIPYVYGLVAADPDNQMPAHPRQVQLEAELLEEVFRPALAVFL
jgi:hypothetical protein